eukprot:4594030-Prymnesium_polylepis.1
MVFIGAGVLRPLSNVLHGIPARATASACPAVHAAYCRGLRIRWAGLSRQNIWPRRHRSFSVAGLRSRPVDLDCALGLRSCVVGVRQYVGKDWTPGCCRADFGSRGFIRSCVGRRVHG